MIHGNVIRGVLHLIREDDDPDLSDDEYERLEELVPTILKRPCRIVCLSQDYQTADGETMPGWGRMIACGHKYADNHTGVCIAFDHVLLTKRLEEHRATMIGMHLTTEGAVVYGKALE